MPNNFGNDNEVRCSFCGKPQSQAKRLISGNGVYICDECVEPVSYTHLRAHET